MDAARVRHEVGSQMIELGDRHAVVRFPPHVVAGGVVLDDVLIAWRTAGVGAGGDRERATGGDGAFAAPDRRLEQRRRRHVGRRRVFRGRALRERGR